MTSHQASFGPAHWAAAGPGTWTKELLRSDGDSFTLFRLGRGARLTLPDSGEARILVLDGELDADGTPLGAGAYRTPTRAVTAGSRCLALLITGPRLGGPADDVFSPEGWTGSGGGLWFRPLFFPAAGETFDERVVGVSYLEPGATAGRHAHATAHRFLFLDGEADDEVLYPDGTRETARRRRGDFVDYPYPVEHQTFSRDGCTILFLHEPTVAV